MQSLNDIIKTMVDRGDDVVTGIGNAFQSLSDIIKIVHTVYHDVTLVVLSLVSKRMQIEDNMVPHNNKYLSYPIMITPTQ